MRRARLGIALGLAIAGCDGGSGPANVLCSALVEVSVTGGSAPQMTWTPDCRVQQVMVLESIAPSLGSPQPRWAVVNVAAGIAPPVRYGQVPAGAQVAVAAEPLVNGHHYAVELSVVELVGSSNVVGHGGFIR